MTFDVNIERYSNIVVFVILAGRSVRLDSLGDLYRCVFVCVLGPRVKTRRRFQ